LKRTCWALTVFLVGCSRFSSEKRIDLRFTPKENVTAAIPATEGLTASRSIDVAPLTDARAITDRSLVGENREHSTMVPIRATSSVTEFATTALKKCLAEWGVRIGTGDLLLRGEITNLLVTEDQTYSTAASMRFRLEDSAGNALWEGIATGAAHQWGSSFKEENYNEEISDALKRTYANLVSNPGFQRALIGRPESGPGPASSSSSGRGLSPNESKMKILEMMKSGLSTSTIASYLVSTRIRPPLDADDLVSWKRAGIAEEVLRAAVEAGK
jgi:hypothetical protein